LVFLKNKGFDLTVDEPVILFLIQQGFHPRLGARPLRDAIEKYLRGVVMEALLEEKVSHVARITVYGDRLKLEPM
jgi:ATP-dependent Clp protease ATP-binding subunit ClpA